MQASSVFWLLRICIFMFCYMQQLFLKEEV